MGSAADRESTGAVEDDQGDDAELARLRRELAEGERALAEARRMLEDSQRLTHVGSWEWDLRSGRVFWSDEMYRLYGYEPGAIPVDQTTAMSHTHPDDRERRARWLERLHEEPGRCCEEALRVVLPDGSERPIVARAILELDASGVPLRYIGTNRDRTSEARFHQTARLLSQIVTSTSEAIYTVDRDLRVRSWNPAAERMYGYTAEEMIGQSLALLYPEATGSGAWHTEARRRDRLLSGDLVAQEYETVRRRKDGTLVHVAATTSPLRDEAGNIIGLVGAVRDITERRRAEAQLAHLANHDALTGLFNRGRFQEELGRLAARSRRAGSQVAVMLMDLDNFKYVNETHGHKAGDELVVSLARALAGVLRPTDVLARFGGDSFGMLIADSDVASAGGLGEELLRVVREHEMPLCDQTISVTASMGIVIFDGIQPSPEEVLADVDRALFQSKEQGRNRLTLRQASDRGWVRDELSRSTEHMIRDALAHDHFELYVQPIVDLRTGVMTQCEALLRLREDGRIIAPAQFLPAAERLGLMHRIDRWVIEHAFALAAEQPDLTIQLNLSGATIDDPGLVDYVAERLKEHGNDPHRIVFELTETAAIGSMAKAREMAFNLSWLGCQFAIDDFGAGFSTFYYLKHFPAQYVKIDGEFLADRRSRTDDLVIESIVKIGRDLGKRTIAEYVSDEARLQRVLRLGVDYGQGHHFAPPFPADRLTGCSRQVLHPGTSRRTGWMPASVPAQVAADVAQDVAV